MGHCLPSHHISAQNYLQPEPNWCCRRPLASRVRAFAQKRAWPRICGHPPTQHITHNTHDTTHRAACRIYTTGWRTLSAMPAPCGLPPPARPRNKRKRTGGEPRPRFSPAPIDRPGMEKKNQNYAHTRQTPSAARAASAPSAQLSPAPSPPSTTRATPHPVLNAPSDSATECVRATVTADLIARTRGPVTGMRPGWLHSSISSASVALQPALYYIRPATLSRYLASHSSRQDTRPSAELGLCMAWSAFAALHPHAGCRRPRAIAVTMRSSSGR
jgi:hypothetical protein